MLLQLFQILCMAHVPSDCIFVHFMYCSTDSFRAKKQASLEEDAFMYHVGCNKEAEFLVVLLGSCSYSQGN